MASPFKVQPTVDDLNASRGEDMVTHLGIEYTAVGEDFLTARMPVDHRTRQPFGLLHGGASVVLAETLGSYGASLSVDMNTHYCVGLDINANHIRAVSDGWVYGTAKPLHIGKRTHVWEIRIVDEADQLVCVSRLTMAVVERKNIISFI